MALLQTPLCDFGSSPIDFNLISTSDNMISMQDVFGANGLLVMFLCNHCPYVKAIIKDLAQDIEYFQSIGIGCVAIMPNDTTNYPEDSFEKMKDFAFLHNFTFEYLVDETQDVARNYGAVCTPDFFGYGKTNGLQYRGRFREMKSLAPLDASRDSDLRIAMEQIADSGVGGQEQSPSMGCSIKWK